MKESKKYVFTQTARIAAGEVACVALMLGIYGLLHRLNLSVVLSGLMGIVLAVGNFLFMAVVATLAADKAQAQDVEGGQKLIKGGYLLRLPILAGLLVLCAWSGYFDILALALPLLFVRPIIMIGGFFGKKEE